MNSNSKAAKHFNLLKCVDLTVLFSLSQCSRPLLPSPGNVGQMTPSTLEGVWGS